MRAHLSRCKNNFVTGEFNVIVSINERPRNDHTYKLITSLRHHLLTLTVLSAPPDIIVVLRALITTPRTGPL